MMILISGHFHSMISRLKKHYHIMNLSSNNFWKQMNRDESSSSCRWEVSPWRPCSKSCGPGLQYRSVTCMHQTRNGTTEESSSHLCPSDKPSGVQNCIKKACHLNWMAGPWSQVSQYLFKTQNLFALFFWLSSSVLDLFKEHPASI